MSETERRRIGRLSRLAWRSEAGLPRHLMLAMLLAPTTAHAGAPQVPPPPPDQLARLRADCGVAASPAIALSRTPAPPPAMSGELHVAWGFTLTPPPGTRIGRIIGLSRTWNGSIIAATDAGLWLRVPNARYETKDGSATSSAVPIRDLPGKPIAMAYYSSGSGWGDNGLDVVVATRGVAHLVRYAVGNCFPGARPLVHPLPAEIGSVTRLLPGSDAPPTLLYRTAAGELRTRPLRPDRADPFDVDAQATEPVTRADFAMRIPAARGCDELSLARVDTRTTITASCSPHYLASLSALWAKPQRQHRQPAPLTATTVIGHIDAPIVAASDVQYHFRARIGERTVRRGDNRDAGQPCSLLLAAQQSADAPVTIYGAALNCAYYPRDPSGAPYPPAPPPF